MKRNSKLLRLTALVTFALGLTLTSILANVGRVGAKPAPVVDSLNNFTVVAGGLNNPRGLKFGPDGNLYVAEGGLGGTHPAVGCADVPGPVGPYTGSNTGGRITRFDQNWNRSTVIDTLPSSQTSVNLGFLISGVADVAFIDNTLYAILAGAGCSHGVTSLPNGIVRINSNGTPTLIADLSAFQQANPVANPELGDFEPDGTWYSMVSVRGALYAVEPNHGEVVKVTPDGQISRVVDVSATQGHIVPTAIAYKGNFFFGNLGRFPVDPGSERIMKLNPAGEIQPWATGLTTIQGLAIDAHDRIYVLESLTKPGFPSPDQIGSGTVVRIDPDGTQTEITTGLSFPGGMTLGPDGALYVSNFSFGAPPESGQIVRIDVGSRPGKGRIHSTNISTSAPEATLPQTKAAIVTGSTNDATNTSTLSVPTFVQGGTEIKRQSDDAEIERVATKMLIDEAELGSVSVSFKDGTAFLTGTVYSIGARTKAENVLKKLESIKSISNQIYVSAP